MLPTDATYPTCAWTSSNIETATVYNGCVKGLKPGKVMIKATALDGSGVETEIEIEVVKATPLAELIYCILNSANGLVVNEVYVLQDGDRTNFANDSGKQTIRYFRIISDDQELVCKL